MQDAKVKVLYVGGWGRSGTTILGNILGSASGLCHVGEVSHIWENGFIDNRACGCQVPFSDCSFWTDVLNEAYEGREKVDPQRMIDFRQNGPQNRNIPRLLLAGRLDASKHFGEEYLANLSKLYTAIQKVSGCRVIVDSSKFPSYAYAVQSLPNVEFYLLHLVRDSRANAYSWLRKFDRTDGIAGKPEMQQRFDTYASSMKWASWNVTMEMMKKHIGARYMRLLYEDFAAHPKNAVERIFDHIGEPADPSTFVDERTATIKISHTPWGNAVRTKIGAVPIRTDDEWKNKMRPLDRWKVSAITWPLLLKYGYYSR